MPVVSVVDTVYTLRFLRLLSMKWVDMDAYKLGIIDETGTPLKKSKELKLNNEKSAYTSFHRLVFKLKRLLEKVPGGKSIVGRYGAALWLIKEHKEEVEQMGIKISVLEEGLKRHYREKGYLNEGINEESACNTSGVALRDPVMSKKPQKRKDSDGPGYKVVDTDEESNVVYQLIGDSLIRVDEGTSRKRVIKKRIVNGKRQKKREFVSGKNSRYTRTGNRKLRGGALAKKRRSLKKALRKSKTGSAKAKRIRSMRKSRAYN